MIGKAMGVAWAVVSAAAQDGSEMAALRAQLAAQGEQMRAMQARIEALETRLGRPSGQSGAAVAPSPPSPPPPVSGPAEPRARMHISGYADVTGIYRSTFTGAGISTPFGSIPLERAPEAQLGEFRGSGAHSRLSFRLDTRLGGRDLTTYIETDFLAAAQPNIFAGSNGHPLRLRLYWAQWRGKQWELLGGQSWSLLAPNRQGISPDHFAIMHTRLIDPNYSVGLAWTRQATVRVTRRWERWTGAVAVENPEQNILDPREVPEDVRGLANRTTPGSNIRPDLLAKLAYDTAGAHLEVAGVGRNFQVYSTRLGVKHNAIGAGVSLAGVIHAGKWVDLVSQNYVSSGGGRYTQGLAPDVVVRPDGRLVRVLSASFLEGIELNLPAGWQVYGYGGLVYGRRAAYRTAGGEWVGFGAPTGSAVDNRTVAETTVGFRHFFWSEEGRGGLSYAVNYSYLNRRLWEMNTAGALGRTHMVYTSFRYNLP